MNGVALLLDAWFLAPALALLFGLLALMPLGHQVLRRGVVFIDLAVAQAAAAAALAAGAYLHHPDWLGIQLGAALGALLGAALVAWLARRWPLQREALIGLIYVAAASLALLAARADPHGRERLSQLLAADVLWADWAQVARLAACALGVLLCSKRLAGNRAFYAVFAVVASLVVPVLGLFVVFAALIAPALWLRAGRHWTQALAATSLGSAAGLWLSWLLDAPSGACVALGLAVVGASAALLCKPH